MSGWKRNSIHLNQGVTALMSENVNSNKSSIYLLQPLRGESLIILAQGQLSVGEILDSKILWSKASSKSRCCSVLLNCSVPDADHDSICGGSF